MPSALPSPQAASAGEGAPSWGRLKRNGLAAFPPEAFTEDFVRCWFMGREQIILNRPAGIRHILVDNADNYVRSRVTVRILHPLLGNGLFLAKGEEWKRQRRTVAPAFAPRMVPLFARRVAEVAELTVARLVAVGEEPIDLLAAMQDLALGVAGRSLLSIEMRRGPQLRRLIRFYADHLSRPGFLDFLLPLAVPSPRDLVRALFRRRWMRLIRQIVAERGAPTAGAAEGDLFDLLEEAAQSPQQLTEQIATMLVAGHETTAIALFWSLYLLAAAPAAQEAVAAEATPLDLSAGGADAARPHLHYTRAVVQEALRLYPPAFTIVREALAADDAGGVTIPARGVVLIASWVLHRQSLLWAEPQRFDPSRFLPGMRAPDRFAYLPFGVEPRICIGAQFAMTEAVLALAALVRAFAFERAGEEIVTPTAIVLTQPDPPPLFRLRPRQRSLCA